VTTAPLVCIVDDAADYGFVLKKLLARSFPACSVSFFAGGRIFLDQLPQLSPLPSLILLDRHMPVLDGHQTLLFLKGQEAYKKIPVVMMSADASAEEINACYEAGTNSFLRKPVEIDLIQKQLDILCRYWLELNLHPA
jgi:CheY-like chemotaxis protein